MTMSNDDLDLLLQYNPDLKRCNQGLLNVRLLAESAKPTPERKAPISNIEASPKEKDIQRACLDYLDANQIMWLRLNSGDTFRPGKEGKFYKVRGCPKGTADILILWRVKESIGCAKSRPIFVEFKASNGKQTVKQAIFERDVESLGYEYYIIRDLDTFVKLFAERYGREIVER